MSFSLTQASTALEAALPFDGADLVSLPAPELLALQRVVVDGKKAWDVLVAMVSGEVGRRSTVDDGAAGLARKQGFATPEQMLADVMGSSPGEANRIVAVGRTLARAEQQAAPGGEAPPSADGLLAKDGTLFNDGVKAHAILAAAIRDDGLSIEKANIIGTTLDSLTGDTVELERKLVKLAARLSVRHLARMCRREAARHDPAELVKKEARQHQERTFDYYEDATGMIVFTGRLDPVTAVPVLTWFDAQVRHAFQAKRDNNNDNNSDTPADDRTAGQIRADALSMLALHGLDCDSPTSGVKCTMVVRIWRSELESELGVGECDALGGPISAAALRQLAVDAEIIPAIMGGESEVLDWGRATRLYTRAQKLAVVERDGGCSWCHAPPSWCAGHHIDWWSNGGPTDYCNLVLLCTRCHNRVHRDGWDITVRDNIVWITPPAEVDPTRTPRMGGKAHLGLVEADVAA